MQTKYFERYDLAGVLYSGSAPPLIFEAACVPGYYGASTEWCLPCPEGQATCLATIDHPEPFSQHGWWQESLPTPNALCPPERQARERCPYWVPCDPKESCGGNNTCSTGYVGQRCTLCAAVSYYRLAGSCVKCPSQPWLVVAMFIVGAVAVTLGAWILNKNQVNIGVMSIGIDYFQVLAMFARSKVPWPPVISTLLNVCRPLRAARMGVCVVCCVIFQCECICMRSSVCR